MFFRALVTSGFLALFFWGILHYLKTNNIFDYASFLTTNYLVLFFWFIGFLSTVAFIYGRRLRKIFGTETGKIKWFDPSKGYGFLIRDKGGDLFVHLDLLTQMIEEN